MFGIGQFENDAIEMLKKDHQEVDSLFDTYESRKEKAKPSEKSQIAKLICHALTVHAAIEEEIFYPAVRKQGGEKVKDQLDEAAVEHQSLKDIVGRLESASPSDALYDAGVKVLSEYVKHHVKEEEGQLFPKVRASDIDLEALGQQMRAQKEDLERTSTRKARKAA
jgi:hemerythrin superfamily protein